MRALLEHLTEARAIHVPLSELPATLRAALKRVKYGARDIAVVPQEKVEPNPYAGEGQKGFVLVVDMATGKSHDLEGGWGGARPDDPREIDFASKPVPIPPGGAIIIGVQGYPRTMATIYVHPDTMARMLPPAPEADDREQMILRTVRSLTSAGRKEVFASQQVQPKEIDALVARGLLSRTKAGAVSITTAGKNVAEGQEDSMRALLRRLEEAKVADGFATRKDIERAGYDAANDDYKPGVPASVKGNTGRGASEVSRALGEGGVFTFRKGFFYKGGGDEHQFAARVAADLAKAGLQAILLSTGENLAPFKGGSKPWGKDSSFFWAIFQVRTAA